MPKPARVQTPLRRVAITTGCLLSFAVAASAQSPAWTYSASAYFYVVPEARDYLQPTITADRARLHLEGRWNYEALNSGSAWIGYNLKSGKSVSLSFTPMIGAVFGSMTAVAPGFAVTAEWRKLQAFAEAESVFDWRDRTDSFLYMWSELTASPVAWLSVGIVGQRTRVLSTGRDVQRGLLARLTYKRTELGGYVLNPDHGSPVYIVSFEIYR